jgi:hypothetical protein
MELKDFVATTLKEIYAGLKDAQTDERSFEIWTTSSIGGGIHFDLAVTSASTTESSTKKEAGLKIKVISAEIDKEGKSTISAESTSRIVFTVNPNE